MTRSPLWGGKAVLIGLVMLAVASFEAAWEVARYSDTMAHERAHAVISSLSGGDVRSIKIKPDGAGQTKPAFGLRAARLIQSGYILSTCWVALILLAVLLLAARWSSAFFAVPLAGALAFFMAKFAPTHAGVPTLLWSLPRLAGWLGAVALGGRMLVMHA